MKLFNSGSFPLNGHDDGVCAFNGTLLKSPRPNIFLNNMFSRYVFRKELVTAIRKELKTSRGNRYLACKIFCTPDQVSQVFSDDDVKRCIREIIIETIKSVSVVDVIEILHSKNYENSIFCRLPFTKWEKKVVHLCVSPLNCERDCSTRFPSIQYACSNTSPCCSFFAFKIRIYENMVIHFRNYKTYFLIYEFRQNIQHFCLNRI